MFQAFLEEVKADYGDVLYHTDVRWLSRGNVLKRFFALRHEIKAFLDEKGMDTSVMQDIDWVADFAFLTDLTGHFNDLNLKLQGSQNLISDLFEAVCAFEIKLRLLTAQLEKGMLAHYPACAEVFPHDKYGGWYRHVKVLKELQNVFENRFSQFKSQRASFKLFADPFSADVDSVQPELQLELIELQCCSALKNKHREMPLLVFYQSLDTAQFPNLSREALKMVSMFGSTYICEQVFSQMKLHKSSLRTRLTDQHLHAILRVGTTSLEPEIQKLTAEKRCNVSH